MVKSIDSMNEFLLDGNFPRYVLEPFEIVKPGDPRYETALTREQVDEMIKGEKQHF